MIIEELVERLLKGETIAAARLISLVENTDENEKIIKLISPYLGNAYIIGITGAPGVGKSTLTDKLVRELRQENKKVGVIAVDPTSPFSGGAILGDRIRLQKLATDEGVFIRSMASRGHLGGISSATSDAIKILDAYGCDYIFIETVGVGQSEIEVVKNVDTTLLVLIPGMGDEIQAIKAGVMEIADIFVVNKADKDGVERIMLEIEMLQNLGERKERMAPISKVIAKDNIGIEKLLQEIQNHKKYLLENDLFDTNRKKRLELEMKQIAHDKLLQKASSILQENYDLKQLIDDVYDKKTDVYSVVNNLIDKVVK
ncbi:MAG: methylmalonyl Co-A mutase-associated GTPase MeaB [Candidatus Cloacimonadales bacterium]|nr:methylmalonyl Co-A mutase-associated GTPase MeaB [Candidatus Cloacimonadales bacterium]